MQPALPQHDDWPARRQNLLDVAAWCFQQMGHPNPRGKLRVTIRVREKKLKMKVVGYGDPDRGRLLAEEFDRKFGRRP